MEREEAYARHVDDSLALLPALDRCLAEQRQRAGGAPGGAPPQLIDVGSGAGLPGILLAIARPEWEVTLLDSLQVGAAAVHSQVWVVCRAECWQSLRRLLLPLLC